MKQNETHDPASNPYFLEAEYIIPANVFGPGRAVALLVVAAGIWLFFEYGWIGILIAAGIGAALMVAVHIARRKITLPGEVPGYVNPYRQETQQCITPKEKYFDQKYYKLKCMDCGKFHHARAPKINRCRCPYCGRK